MSDFDYSVFTDISVLTDYCCVHSVSHADAETVLEEIHRDRGELVISKQAGRSLHQRLANRQRLLEHLFRESSKHLKEAETESVAEVTFRANVLNYVDLDQTLPFGLSEEYTSDIGNLREHLDDIGLRKFRRRVDNFKKEGQRCQNRLENVLIDHRYNRGGRDTWLLELSIGNITHDDIQTESLTDAVCWCQSERGGTVLIRHTDPAYKNRVELISYAQKYLPQVKPDIVSPIDVIDYIE